MQDTIWANDGEIKIATISDLPWVTLSSGRRTSDCETEEANARLIASAPELLAALIEVSHQHDELLAAYGKPFGWGRLVTDQARQAIAKATNQTE